MHKPFHSQNSYANTVLAWFNMASANSVKCPMAPGAIYNKDQSPTNAQEIVHMCTFMITTLSQFLNNPGVSHWEGVKCILCYVSGTTSVKLTYGIDHHNLIGYTDTNGASQPHHHAISGYAFLLDGGAISWSCKKQGLITVSTTEVEYVAATHAAMEAFWLQKNHS